MEDNTVFLKAAGHSPCKRSIRLFHNPSVWMNIFENTLKRNERV
jgi:hypothetical protein